MSTYREYLDKIYETKHEEIFKFEYWNHECGYTGDYSEALEITQIYFEDYIPSAKLLTQLYRQGE